MTLLSPQDTASSVPDAFQDTRHTGAGKAGSADGLHSPPAAACRHTMTRPSSPQEASVLPPAPAEEAGHQATSRAQSLCPRSSASRSHAGADAAAADATAASGDVTRL